MRPTLLATLAAVSSLALGACADGDGGTLFIAGIVEPDDECILPGNPDTFRSRGFVNVDLANGFTLTPLVTNGVVDPSTLNDSTAPQATINVQSADVSLLNVSDELLDFGGSPNPYSVTATASIPGSESRPMAFDAIPEAYLDALPGAVGLTSGTTSVVLAVQLRGRTAGGESVITPEFKYTVNLLRTATPGRCPDNATVVCGGEDDDLVTPCPGLGQDRTAVLDPACGECLPEPALPFCVCPQ